MYASIRFVLSNLRKSVDIASTNIASFLRKNEITIHKLLCAQTDRMTVYIIIQMTKIKRIISLVWYLINTHREHAHGLDFMSFSVNRLSAADYMHARPLFCSCGIPSHISLPFCFLGTNIKTGQIIFDISCAFHAPISIKCHSSFH